MTRKFKKLEAKEQLAIEKLQVTQNSQASVQIALDMVMNNSKEAGERRREYLRQRKA